ARQHPNLLLLIRPREVEPRHVSTRVHFAIPKLEHVFTATYLLPDRLVRIERATLIDIREHDSLTFANSSCIRRLLFRDHAKQRRLASAVWTNHTDDAARR